MLCQSSQTKTKKNLKRLDYGYGTVEKVTLSGGYRRINVSFMKISHSQGAEFKITYQNAADVIL